MLRLLQRGGHPANVEVRGQRASIPGARQEREEVGRACIEVKVGWIVLDAQIDLPGGDRLTWAVVRQVRAGQKVCPPNLEGNVLLDELQALDCP
jgi:hypothetical protein